MIRMSSPRSRGLRRSMSSAPTAVTVAGAASCGASAMTRISSVIRAGLSSSFLGSVSSVRGEDTKSPAARPNPRRRGAVRRKVSSLGEGKEVMRLTPFQDWKAAGFPPQPYRPGGVAEAALAHPGSEQRGSIPKYWNGRKR